jgi:LemA protein
MDKILIGVLLVVLVLILVYVIATYNSLVQLRNRVKDQWSQIDIQLKRRFDLIPNLVETVKGYMNHEKDTLKEIVEARNTYNSATTHEDAVNADTELTKSVSKLFALAEAYPELKANENFNSLQAELSETEDKISSARQFYSDTVLKYNNKIQMFPGSIVAAIFGFKEEKFFEATAVEKENVKVSFDK